jgi:hypothetical protein
VARETLERLASPGQMHSLLVADSTKELDGSFFQMRTRGAACPLSHENSTHLSALTS